MLKPIWPGSEDFEFSQMEPAVLDKGPPILGVPELSHGAELAAEVGLRQTGSQTAISMKRMKASG